MAEQIEGTDGVSAGKNIMGVNSQGLALTKALTQEELEAAAEEGRSYNINTGSITLTTANKSACLYVKNNSTKDVIIPLIGFLIGNSTGGTGDLLLEVVRNPTAGTIVSGASAVDVEVNKNFGSNKTLTVDAYKGAEGNTITDGATAYYSLMNSAAKQYVITTGWVVLPKGSSLGINVTPQASNTSMAIQCFLSVIEQA